LISTRLFGKSVSRLEHHDFGTAAVVWKRAK
jgi:hypothetical protein